MVAKIKRFIKGLLRKCKLVAYTLFLGFVQRAIFSYEMTSDNHAKVVREMINDWVAICNLYTVVRDFAGSYNGKSFSYSM